eukprot:1849675-Alexandrium_andersonii.AAC.1
MLVLALTCHRHPSQPIHGWVMFPHSPRGNVALSALTLPLAPVLGRWRPDRPDPVPDRWACWDRGL